tara:strand:+ start:2194 stop:3000 length:807 start_codon:yes stop_codon:yes gene_type:complete
MTELIAEIGWNHMGNMKIAEEMICKASESGAKYAKFQTWSVDRLESGEWDHDGRRQIYEKAQLSYKDHEFLIELCKKYKINFLSSCFSIEDAILLKDLGQKKIKIPSFEVRNSNLIEFCLRHFDHVFISTGTANSKDLYDLKERVEGKSTTIMHCVSSYPCNYENANLPRILKLNEMFNDVGYSDHIEGIDASIASLEFSPTHIEKHFTIDNNLPGRDNKFAILPNELLSLSNFIRNKKLLMIDHGINYQSCEEISRKDYAGRFSKLK